MSAAFALPGAAVKQRTGGGDVSSQDDLRSKQKHQHGHEHQHLQSASASASASALEHSVFGAADMATCTHITHFLFQSDRYPYSTPEIKSVFDKIQPGT
jgi:hypothetical protein